MTDNISKKDKKDWEDFISANQKLPDKDRKFAQTKKIKAKSIDLHGYTLDQANKVIDSFIRNSYEANIRKLVIVTGKGLHSENEKNPFVSKDLSILKYSVPEYIKSNTDLMNKILEMKDANIEDGGSGAFYIYLKNK